MFASDFLHFYCLQLCVAYCTSCDETLENYILYFIKCDQSIWIVDLRCHKNWVWCVDAVEMANEPNSVTETMLCHDSA